MSTIESITEQLHLLARNRYDRFVADPRSPGAVLSFVWSNGHVAVRDGFADDPPGVYYPFDDADVRALAHRSPRTYSYPAALTALYARLAQAWIDSGRAATALETFRRSYTRSE